MVTSNEQDMIVFTSAHVLHIPIKYHQERLKDKVVNVYMVHYLLLKNKFVLEFYKFHNCIYFTMFLKHLQEC